MSCFGVGLKAALCWIFQQCLSNLDTGRVSAVAAPAPLRVRQLNSSRPSWDLGRSVPVSVAFRVVASPGRTNVRPPSRCRRFGSTLADE
jgi:hypothetical protein